MDRTHEFMRAHCTIVGGDKLAHQSVSDTTICETIKRAIASRGGGDNYSVKVKVLSASRLTAAVEVNGRALPEQRFAVMDRNLSPRSLQHFADSLAALIAQAKQRTS